MSDVLSSDILEEQFGPTRLEILYRDSGSRIISTISGDGQVLELSWVRFHAVGPELAHLHEEVVGGKSIGKAFRDLGIEFTRQTHGTYACAQTANISKRFKASGPVTVVEVSVLAGPERTPYADILEVYSPPADWPDTAAVAPDRILKELRDFDGLLTDISA